MFRFSNLHASGPAAAPPTPAGFEHGKASSRRRVRDAEATPAFLDLLTFLEAEPAVVSFDFRHDGILDVRYSFGRVLVGVLPPSGPGRLHMQALKRDHEGAGRRVILVPEARLARRPFRDNRRIIAGSAGASMTADQRLRVLDAVDDAGSAALGDLARMLGTDDAAEGILALVANGTLRIDISEPIDGNSMVSRFEPEA